MLKLIVDVVRLKLIVKVDCRLLIQVYSSNTTNFPSLLMSSFSSLTFLFFLSFILCAFANLYQYAYNVNIGFEKIFTVINQSHIFA